jgi:hypothetical protein
MIRSLSETLKAVLHDTDLADRYPELLKAQVNFDRPTSAGNAFPPKDQNTINLFLYDIRENMELRTNEPVRTRNNGGITISRPPLRVACSYLLTAWPISGEDIALQEHRLLSQALEVLSRYPTIPSTYLQDKLAGQTPPLPMMTAKTDSLKDPAEFWTAIGNQLRASIVVTATIALDTVTLESAQEVLASRLQINAGMPTYQIAGRVTQPDGTPIVGATATLVELGLVGATDADGRYVLGSMAAGTYTVRVRNGSAVKSASVPVPPPPYPKPPAPPGPRITYDFLFPST